MRRLSNEDFPQELRRAYDVVCPLGNGSFGDVFRAISRPGKPVGFPDEVAIKLVPVSANGLSRQLQEELNNHFKCFSPQIVPALDIIFVPGRVAIVMELIPGGNMFDFVKDSRHFLHEDMVRWIFQQLVLGVYYLHKLGIAQRDIKLENVLIVNPDSEWPNVKITDFGYSKDCEQAQSRVGTLAYMPPEIYFGRGISYYDGRRADMWSCGIMLYVMLFSRYPFDLNPDNRPKYDREVERMQRGAYELPGHPQISGLCQDMLKQLITADPDERLTSEQCLSHPWFQQDLPATAIEAAHEHLRRTEQRWSSGRRREFERKMQRRADGSSLFEGFLNRLRPN